MIELPKIILASASPRRAEILRTVGWPFETLAVDIDESRRESENATDYVQRLALEKAEAAAAQRPDLAVVGADTTVAIDSHILEKPTDEGDATRMLQLLNNRWHKVVTGVAIIDRATSVTKVAREETEVKFAPLSDAEIRWYVATREPMDKAGAYGIQGYGATIVRRIDGDFFAVMGLSLMQVVKLMAQLGVRYNFPR